MLGWLVGEACFYRYRWLKINGQLWLFHPTYRSYNPSYRYIGEKQNDGGGKVHQFEIFHPSYNWYIGGNKMTGGGKVHQFEAHPYHR